MQSGQRAKRLGELLSESGLKLLVGQQPRPRLDDLPPAIARELLRLYRTLGGREEHPRLAPGPWDLRFTGGLIVELDEALHFNRYRAITLKTSWTRSLPWRTAYRQHCSDHEHTCLKEGQRGKTWTSPATARMYAGGPIGDLEAGAPRWKQRALYDAQKDAALIAGMPIALARVSIYDDVAGVPLNAMLLGKASADVDGIRELVNARTATP